MDSYEAKFIFSTRIDGCEMDYYKLCTIINFFWGSPMFIFNNRKRKEKKGEKTKAKRKTQNKNNHKCDGGSNIIAAKGIFGKGRDL